MQNMMQQNINKWKGLLYMKKLFSLFLALSLLFLTACNTNPPTSSDGSSSSNTSSDTDLPFGTAIPEDTVVTNLSSYHEVIETPSRIIFNAQIGSGEYYNVYYSKADGKVYPYCFDSLCDHSGGKCLAVPGSLYDEQNLLFDSISLTNIRFINDRFYAVSANSGRILSFNFDGTNMKIEYDGQYSTDFICSQGVWKPNIMVYGPYIYIDQRPTTSSDGKPHTLRFNVTTKEMEDLTEKTGNYAYPSFFYNNEMYGNISSAEPIKASLDLSVFEERENIGHFTIASGSKLFGRSLDAQGKPDGILSYNMKTGETFKIDNTSLESPAIDSSQNIVYVDENYIYFYHYVSEKIGKAYYARNTKLYRVKHDGDDLLCIYENPSFSFDGHSAAIFDGKILIEGHYFNGSVNYDRGYYVGTFGEDGIVEELKPIEFVG